MELFILRHGKASREPPPGGTDDDRTLTSRGRKDIARVAGWMEETGIEPDAIGSSPLLRARETAGIVAGTLHRKAVTGCWDELRPGGDLDALTARILPAGDLVLIVGHEPQLSALAARIISGAGARIRLGKGGLAMIGEIDSAGHGELRWLLTPDLINTLPS
jgi:phosphohistidine phosphatase